MKPLTIGNHQGVDAKKLLWKERRKTPSIDAAAIRAVANWCEPEGCKSSKQTKNVSVFAASLKRPNHNLKITLTKNDDDRLEFFVSVQMWLVA